MTYEVKIPLVVESIELVRTAMAGLQDGSLDRATVNAMLSASGKLQSAVNTDVRARIAYPRIAAQEAKLIEQQRAAPEALEKPPENP